MPTLLGDAPGFIGSPHNENTSDVARFQRTVHFDAVRMIESLIARKSEYRIFTEEKLAAQLVRARSYPDFPERSLTALEALMNRYPEESAVYTAAAASVESYRRTIAEQSALRQQRVLQ